MTRKLLIVNGDDFGLSPGVNRGVIRAHREGILSSASLMANTPYVEEATEMAREHPELGLGLHVNLTQGPPVAPASLLSRLLGADGLLPSIPVLMLNAWRASDAIRIEIAAQLERLLGLGATIEHFDSHKHVHVHPSVLRAAISVAKEYGIRAIRSPVESQSASISAGFGGRRRAILVSALAMPGRAKLSRFGLAFTDHFVGIARTGNWNAATMAKAVSRVGNGATELMVHPGEVDPVLRSSPTRLIESRQAELDCLISRKVASAVKAGEIEIGNYAALLDRSSRD